MLMLHWETSNTTILLPKLWVFNLSPLHTLPFLMNRAFFTFTVLPTVRVNAMRIRLTLRSIDFWGPRT